MIIYFYTIPNLIVLLFNLFFTTIVIKLFKLNGIFVYRYVMKAIKLFLKVCSRSETNSRNVIFSNNIFTILDLLSTELNVIIIIYY